jgi:hypothetical protein
MATHLPKCPPPHQMYRLCNVCLCVTVRACVRAFRAQGVGAERQSAVWHHLPLALRSNRAGHP